MYGSPENKNGKKSKSKDSSSDKQAKSHTKDLDMA